MALHSPPLSQLRTFLQKVSNGPQEPGASPAVNLWFKPDIIQEPSLLIQVSPNLGGKGAGVFLNGKWRKRGLSFSLPCFTMLHSEVWSHFSPVLLMSCIGGWLEENQVKEWISLVRNGRGRDQLLSLPSTISQWTERRWRCWSCQLIWLIGNVNVRDLQLVNGWKENWEASSEEQCLNKFVTHFVG